MTEQPIKSDTPMGMPQELKTSERLTMETKLREDYYHITIEDIDAVRQLAENPHIEDVLFKDLHRTVAEHDDHVSKANFHTALSMYNVAVNNAVKAESGAGKSYGTTETVDYLPNENVIIIGSQSPKVVSHEYGELMTGDDEPLNLEDVPIKPHRKDYETKEEFLEALETYKAQKKQWNKKLKQSYYLIRLSNTTIVFLDTISVETFEMFKSILSHDKPRIMHRYVDDRGKVHTTILEGWPSAIFCSTDKKFISEFTTRTFTVSPSIGKEKIARSMGITSQKKSYPWEYEEDSNIKIWIKTLIRNIRDVFKQYGLKVVIPFPHLDDLFSKTAVRDMRDYNHFTEILPAYTMLKTFQRPIITIKGRKYLVASLEDVVEAKKLFDLIAETTKTGTEQHIIDFYRDFVKPKVNGVNLKTLVKEYNDENKDNPRSDYAIRWYLKRLNKIGWVDIRKGEDATDKRKDTFYPLKGVDDPQQKFGETTVKTPIQPDLELKLKLDFKEWLETIGKNNLVTQCEKISFYERKLSPITTEEFVKKIVGVSINDLQIVSKVDLEPKEETEPKSSGTGENQPDSPILNVYRVHNGEPCICGLYAVSMELHDTVENKRKRLCDLCGKDAKRRFLENGYNIVYPCGEAS